MGRYDKYICTELFKRENLPGPAPAQRDVLAAEGSRISMEHIYWIDNDVIPGAYYGEFTWIWPASYPNQISAAELARRYGNARPMFPHSHDFPEILSWWGTDPDHPEDTNTLGMLMGDREILLEKSWVGYIPAGVQHMPVRKPGFRISTKPVCHWTSGPGAYSREKEPADGQKPLQPKPQPGQSEAKPLLDLDMARYFIFDYKAGVMRPKYMAPLDPSLSRPVAYIDQTVIPGAEFGCDAFWLVPGDRPGTGQMIMEKRRLPHGASITLAALNYADIRDLCAEAEFWIGGEKHIINKSFGAYIPPNVEAGPLIIRNVTRQIFFLMTRPIGEGIIKYPGQ